MDQAERTRAENIVRQLLTTTGEPDLFREGLIDTPKRVIKMYEEVFSGYNENPYDILGTTFEDEDHDELIIVRKIPFYSLCEHHMVPFFGHVDIGYIPMGKIVGISKMARLVDCFAKRLQIQERITTQIADSINCILDPLGVMVRIEAEHLCMAMRGIKKPGTLTVTSAVRGVFGENSNNARAEFLELIK
jgi:GTP cyclohydrolase I